MVLTSFHDKKSSLEMWCICRLTTPEVKTDPDSRESQSPDPLSDGESNMADCDQIPLAEDDSILSDGPSIAGLYCLQHMNDMLYQVNYVLCILFTKHTSTIHIGMGQVMGGYV